MLDISIILEKYPNVNNIFSRQWFETELNKDLNQRHPLIGALNCDNDRIFCHLERLLDSLKDEIEQNHRHFARLKSVKYYYPTLAEIEACYLFREMGFAIEVERKNPDSEKSCDINLIDNDIKIFIEVSIVDKIIKDKKSPRGKNNELLTRLYYVEEPPLLNIYSKILDEAEQLPENYPGIIILYLDESIVIDISPALYDAKGLRTDNEIIITEMSSSAFKANRRISGLLCLRGFGKISHSNAKFYENPYSVHPLPISVISRIKSIGVAINDSIIEVEEEQIDEIGKRYSQKVRDKSKKDIK